MNSTPDTLDGPEHVLGYVIGIRGRDGENHQLLQSRPRANPEHLRRQLDGYGDRVDVAIYELREVHLPRKAGGR